MNLSRAVEYAEDILILEIPVTSWIEMFLECHNIKTESGGGKGKKKVIVERTEWPDGGCLLEQYFLTVEIFRVLKNTLRDSV